jgi:hypothetical protein
MTESKVRHGASLPASANWLRKGKKYKGFEGGTLVTQEEVVKLKKLLWRDLVYLETHGFRNFIGEEAEPIVDRLWQEVQDLRSKLTKQIY